MNAAIQELPVHMPGAKEMRQWNDKLIEITCPPAPIPCTVVKLSRKHAQWRASKRTCGAQTKSAVCLAQLIAPGWITCPPTAASRRVLVTAFQITPLWKQEQVRVLPTILIRVLGRYWEPCFGPYLAMKSGRDEAKAEMNDQKAFVWKPSLRTLKICEHMRT